MKITYDSATDTLTVVLRDRPARISEQEKSGVILDYDADREAHPSPWSDRCKKRGVPVRILVSIRALTGAPPISTIGSRASA